MRGGRLAIGLVAVSIAAPGARADEQTKLVVQSGMWGAMEHRDSTVAAPDICILLNPTQGVAFRMSDGGTQFRVIDDSWSLPTGVQGDIILTIGTWTATFPVNDNTSNQIMAEIPAESVDDIFNKMDKAATMSATIGKERPRSISLSGSSKAAVAFLTCAGLHSDINGGGSNPFKK